MDNKQLKEFAQAYNNSFLNFIKTKIRSRSEKQILETDEFVSKYDKLVFGKEKEELPYTLSKCCHPIAGDKVFGFLTINEGVKVHKNNCPNAIALQSNYAYRILPAWWIDSSEQEFSAILRLSGIDQIGLVNQVTRVISNNMHVHITKINFSTTEELFNGLIHLKVKNKSTLKKLIQNLYKISGIDKVIRE